MSKSLTLNSTFYNDNDTTKKSMSNSPMTLTLTMTHLKSSRQSHSVGGIMVSIAAFQAVDPGSIRTMQIFVIELFKNTTKIKEIGGAGYRSRYLSHAKRALYHLSYAPTMGHNNSEVV